MKTLKNQIETLLDNSQYEEAALLVAKKLGFEIEIEFDSNRPHFDSDYCDNTYRDVYGVTIKRGSEIYSFEFGQSISNSGNNRKSPTYYEIISCLQKYDIGDYQEFCDMFGYDESSSYDLYIRVGEELNGMQSLFNDEELETLSLIN